MRRSTWSAASFNSAGLAIEAGRTGFDLLKGDLAYKYRFGAEPRRIGALRIARDASARS